MSMSQIPSYSNDAVKSIGLFYRALQDIEIYVEDIGSEALYFRLFKRILSDNIRVRKVIPLGGRKNVVDVCKEYSENSPAIFIIDGDLDLLHGEREGSHERLFQHRMYCIENYLFCEKASSEILQETVGTILEDEAYDKLDWNGFTTEISGRLLELFKVFAISWKICPEEKTISTGYYKLCEEVRNKSHVLCENKIQNTINGLKEKISRVISDEDYLGIYDNVSNAINSLSNPLYAISGKDYLLNALRDHLYRKGATLRNDEGFRFRLAQHCDVEPFIELKDAISRTVNGESYIQEES
jgi:hypothetical protein